MALRIQLRPLFLLGSALLLAAAATQACGGDDSTTTTPDGSTPMDGSMGGDSSMQPDTSMMNDSGGGDSGGDGGMMGDAGQDSGPSIGYQCGSGTVSDCSMCDAGTQECAYCDTMDASVIKGVCTPLHQNCFLNVPMGFEDCRCGTMGMMVDAGTCPEAYQVCTAAGRCHTCSDQMMNNGLMCQGGGTCHYGDGGCN